MTLSSFYSLSFCALLIVACTALLRLRRGFDWIAPIFGWIAGLMYFVLIPLGLIVLNGSYTNLSSPRDWTSVDLSDKANLAPFITIWISLFTTFMVVIVNTPRKRLTKRDPLSSISMTGLRVIVLGLFSVIASTWTIGVLAAGGLTSYLSSHWYTRGDRYYEVYGYFYVLYQHMLLAIDVIFVAAAVLYTIVRLITRRAAFFDVALWLIPSTLVGEMVFSGNRIHLAAFGIALITALYVRHFRKTVVVALLVLVMVAPFMSMWATLRGDVTDWSARVSMHEDALNSSANRSEIVLMDTFDGSGVTLLFRVIRDFGDTERFLYGQSYLRALIFFVPRSLYADKPQNFNVVLADIYERGETTSLSATVLGEVYANFSFVGILLFPVIAFVLLRISSRMCIAQGPNILKQTIGCVFLIHSIRFGLPVVCVDYMIAMLLCRVMKLERLTVTSADDVLRRISQGLSERSRPQYQIG